MRALIFNSGLGSRMGELTKDKPKALLELKSGETILGRQLRLLKNAGVTDITITTGYRHQDIIDFCKSEFSDLNIQCIENPKYSVTNSIYSMFLALGQFYYDTIVMHGDLVFSEGLLRAMLDNLSPNLACINPHIRKPEKDFKGRISYNKLTQIGVNLFYAEDYALQPIYKLSEDALQAWHEEIKRMVKKGEDNVYAENALNVVLPKLKVRTIDYSYHYIEEVDDINDFQRVSEEIKRYDFNKQILKYGDYLKRLKEIFKPGTIKRPLIVYSRAALKNKEFLTWVESVNAVLFKDYSSNPKYEEVIKGLELFKKNKCDAIIAIGGGSCIDTAKSIKAFSELKDIGNYLDSSLKFAKTPLIAVPTTAGTGSEATRYAVIYKNEEKISLTHDSLFPNMVILDNTFLINLPLYHKKASFLDAFCQAIEGFWAKKATMESRQYSERALFFLHKDYKHYFYEYYYVYPYILKASYLAGQSINISATTAAHAMSYKLTSLIGIAHGHAVSLTLPYLYDFMLEKGKNDKVLMKTFNKLAKLFHVTKEELGTILHKVVNDVGLEVPKVTKELLSILVNSVNSERLANNPLFLTNKDIEEIYRKALIVEEEVF